MLEFESAGALLFVRRERGREVFQNRWIDCESRGPDVDFAVRERWVLRRQGPFNCYGGRIQECSGRNHSAKFRPNGLVSRDETLPIRRPRPQLLLQKVFHPQIIQRFLP